MNKPWYTFARQHILIFLAALEFGIYSDSARMGVFVAAVMYFALSLVIYFASELKEGAMYVARNPKAETLARPTNPNTMNPSMTAGRAMDEKVKVS